MLISPFNQRVRIEQVAGAVDADYGTAPQQWLLFGEYWASLTDNEAKDSAAITQVTSDVVVSRQRVMVSMRLVPGVFAGMRLIELDGRLRTLTVITPAALSANRQEITFLAEVVSV